MNREEQIKILKNKTTYDFDDLRAVMALLRSEGGCPWDIEQTHESIRKDFIEETYEVIEAIDNADPVLLQEELGDVLLQVVFHARIEEEKNVFSMDDVITELCTKLIHRHPHVFGDVLADTSDKVLQNWEKIKNEEKKRETVSERLHSIPPALPALMRAAKVGKRASCFDFPDAASAFSKIKEETIELEEAFLEGEQGNIEEELGDLLFSVANFARKMKIDPELALTNATNKFISRFGEIEAAATDMGKTVENMSQNELDALWEAKKSQKLSK